MHKCFSYVNILCLWEFRFCNLMSELHQLFLLVMYFLPCLCIDPEMNIGHQPSISK